eukprot:jgi/Galph1/1849/GphlegSOOS_G529.1
MAALRSSNTFTHPQGFLRNFGGLQRIIGLLVQPTSLEIAISDENCSRRNCAPFGFLFRQSVEEDARLLSRALKFAGDGETAPFIVGGAVVGLRCVDNPEARTEAAKTREYVESLFSHSSQLNQISSILYVNQAAALKCAILRREDYQRAREKIVKRLLENRPPGSRLPYDRDVIKSPEEIIALSATDILEYALQQV